MRINDRDTQIHTKSEPTEDMIGAGIVEWLLAGDASIRWQTKRDLLDATPDEVDAERSLVSTTGWGQQLLDRQDPDDTWADGLTARSGHRPPTPSCC